MRAGGILAIDLSLSTGWAYGFPMSNEPPAFGVWLLGKMKDQHGELQLGRCMSCLAGSLDDLIERARPARVVFESPIVKHQTTARLLNYLAGTVELVCYEHDQIECREAAAPTARKLILGRSVPPTPKGVKRHPDAVKNWVMAWARQQGHDPADHNEADALVLLRYACIMARSRVTAGAPLPLTKMKSIW